MTGTSRLTSRVKLDYGKRLSRAAKVKLSGRLLILPLGWLEVRKLKLPEGSRWTSRMGEITNERLHERAFRVTSDEVISDLEPNEIDLVYSKANKCS
jgi:hypothetical protein